MNLHTYFAYFYIQDADNNTMHMIQIKVVLNILFYVLFK